MERISALEKIESFYTDENELFRRKAEYFDRIANLFYTGNFGVASKAEIELLMFSIFMDEMIDHNSDDQGVLNYKNCSDYKMAEMLGIPQEKIKGLKIKKQARYPRYFDWKKSFRSIQDSIVYDADKKKIVIPVTDPNLYLSIRNFIEENDGYIEIQRGTNVLQMRPDHFCILLYLGLEDEKEKKKFQKEFVKKLKEKNEGWETDNILTDKEVTALAMNTGDDVFELFESIAEGIENPLLGVIKGIRTIGKIINREK